MAGSAPPKRVWPSAGVAVAIPSIVSAHTARTIQGPVGSGRADRACVRRVPIAHNATTVIVPVMKPGVCME